MTDYKLGPDYQRIYGTIGASDVIVYREYRPMSDNTEYTAYFTIDGEFCRTDWTVEDDLLSIIHETAEQFIAGILYERIRVKAYRDAKKPVK